MWYLLKAVILANAKQKKKKFLFHCLPLPVLLFLDSILKLLAKTSDTTETALLRGDLNPT